MGFVVNNNKKIYFVLLGLFFLVVILWMYVRATKQPTQPSTQATFNFARLYWSPNDITLSSGQKFIAGLIFDAGKNPISAMDVVITYNPQHLQFLTKSVNQQIAAVTVQKTEPGRVTFSAIPPNFATDPDFSSGGLASLSFLPIATATATEINISSESIAAYNGQNFLNLGAGAKLKITIR